MNSPLSLLTSQTFVRGSNFGSEVDPDNLIAAPSWQTSAANIPAANARQVIEIDATKEITVPVITADAVELSNACANCAFAYNLPDLMCAVNRSQTKLLSTCKAYTNPFTLLKARSQ
jgi:hypothetical protein